MEHTKVDAGTSAPLFLLWFVSLGCTVAYAADSQGALSGTAELVAARDTKHAKSITRCRTHSTPLQRTTMQ
jgi:hypothetical protein